MLSLSTLPVLAALFLPRTASARPSISPLPLPTVHGSTMSTTRTLRSLTVAHPSTPSVLSHLTTLLLFPPPPPLTAPKMRVSPSLDDAPSGCLRSSSRTFCPTVALTTPVISPSLSAPSELLSASTMFALPPPDGSALRTMVSPPPNRKLVSWKIAGFATALLAEWAPNPFSFYVKYMGRFHRHYPDLHCPFANAIFSACTFNLGPRTCALGHRLVNFALGWCPIIAFGDFDYKKGGHLILWGCKLIIEFPPGCTILIPSAAVFHSKIPIAPHGHRYSFTQYTAGGLFRWVEHGFKSEEDYFASLSAEGRREEKILGRQRAAAAADMFSTIAELRAMDV
ncbi:hypothetical protein C8R47DRAFT_1000536 [Mycena vitilis]|nr:hypothetical protein C8R47DRAFT_1000536 [Mycena vitilis]